MQHSVSTAYLPVSYVYYSVLQSMNQKEKIKSKSNVLALVVYGILYISLQLRKFTSGEKDQNPIMIQEKKEKKM